MSHPLDPLFRPRSVAIIGASSDPTRIGGRPVRFTKHGFKGAIVPINPNQKEIQGLTAYASIKDAPGEIDQAIIAVPAKAAMQATDECIAKGVKAAVMFSSGFAEIGTEGRAMQTELARRCAAGGMKLVGPNSLGMLDTAHRALLDLLVILRSALAACRAGRHRQPERRVRHVFPRDRGGAGARFFPLRCDRQRGRRGRRRMRRLARRRPRHRRDHDLSRGLPRRRAAACSARQSRGEPQAGRRHEVGVSEQGVAAIASHTGSLAGSRRCLRRRVSREQRASRALAR